jgi:hypothetical protein
MQVGDCWESPRSIAAIMSGYGRCVPILSNVEKLEIWASIPLLLVDTLVVPGKEEDGRWFSADLTCQYSVKVGSRKICP